MEGRWGRRDVYFGTTLDKEGNKYPSVCRRIFTVQKYHTVRLLSIDTLSFYVTRKTINELVRYRLPQRFAKVMKNGNSVAR